MHVSFSYPTYYDVNDFKIVDTIIIHDYSDDENEVQAFNIEVGTLHRVQENGAGNIIRDSPITRWMTKKQLERLQNWGGQVVM